MKKTQVYWLFVAFPLCIFESRVLAHDQTPHGEAPLTYRNDFVLTVRKQGMFKVPMPDGQDMALAYGFDWGKPLFSEPIKLDSHDDDDGSDPGGYYALFWDKIFLGPGSTLKIGTNNIPLTCVYVVGQDNRHAKPDSPLIPDIFLKVYIVANDFSCAGPINPGWPENGLKKELWDTYLYYEIRDPTIMLPTEVRIRYRWNEFSAVVVDRPTPSSATLSLKSSDKELP